MKYRSWLLPAAALAMALAITPSQAATWNFSYTSTDGLDVSGMGSFATAGTATSPELVTSITGTASQFGVTSAITGVAGLTDSSVFDFDNLFSATEPYFDEDGLVFYIGTDTDGNLISVNLASDGAGGYLVTESDTTFLSDSVALTITSVGDTTPPPAIPEPSGMALMLAGLGLASALARRRARR